MNNNNKKLAGKAALVTGVSRRNGIGYGISKRLAMYGANLFLHSFTPFDIAHSNKVDENEIELIYKSLTEYGISVKQLEADFSNENSPGKVFNSALKQSITTQGSIRKQKNAKLRSIQMIISYPQFPALPKYFMNRVIKVP